MKKAQAAMEFLMTYGWAILVVLIAIGALAYFGVLTPERFLPEKCIISSGSGLFCEDFSSDAAGDKITLRIKNILTDSVTLTKVKISAPGITCTDYTASTAIAADKTADIGVNCTLASGDKVKGEITIDYSKAGGLAKSTTGTIVTRIP